jgi:transcriptional regulator with XRE-family HTH domain
VNVSIIETKLSSGQSQKVSIFDNDYECGAMQIVLMPTKIHDKGRRPSHVYLREWRDAMGLNQDQLAERLETSKSVISKLETGKQRYNQDWLEAYAFALGVDVQMLFRHPDAPTPDELLKMMTPEKRKTALQLLETLAKSA